MSGLAGGDFIHRELGRQTAMMEGISRALEESRQETKEHRKELRQDLAEITDRLEAVEALSRKNSKAITEEIMPTVIAVNVLKQRGIGFLTFAGIAGTGLGITIAKYAETIRETFGSFFK